MAQIKYVIANCCLASNENTINFYVAESRLEAMRDYAYDWIDEEDIRKLIPTASIADIQDIFADCSEIVSEPVEVE